MLGRFFTTLPACMRWGPTRAHLPLPRVKRMPHLILANISPMQISHIHAALARAPNLRVTVLLDALRSTREGPTERSGASLVARLAGNFPDRVDVRLYHTPALRGLMKRILPRRFDEGWGLQHMKLYGFDDSVVISG